MLRKLVTTQVQTTADIRNFFDDFAHAYSERHGHPDRLLNYRVSLIKKHAGPSVNDVALDIGCGNGHHLFALARDIGRGIGVDLSPAMIEVARRRLDSSPARENLTFISDDAEKLDALPDRSVDLAICVGAFEHMLNKPAVLENTHRVLKLPGRFFCLTLNGGYFWYRALAPLLGLETRHLSTDRFLKSDELLRLLSAAGFRRVEVGYWTFIPKGDMPRLAGLICQGLDLIGRVLRIHSLRGGLWVCARKED